MLSVCNQAKKGKVESSLSFSLDPVLYPSKTPVAHQCPIHQPTHQSCSPMELSNSISPVSHPTFNGLYMTTQILMSPSLPLRQRPGFIQQSSCPSP